MIDWNNPDLKYAFNLRFKPFLMYNQLFSIYVTNFLLISCMFFEFIYCRLITSADEVHYLRKHFRCHGGNSVHVVQAL